MPGHSRSKRSYLIAVVACVAVVAAVIIAMTIRNGDHSEAAGRSPSTSAPATPVVPHTQRTTPEPTPRAGSDDRSICGLPAGKPLTQQLKPPTAVWKYDGAIGYPTSPSYGPGQTSAAGFRYCYQHSAPGALFAAAGSIAFNNRSKEAARAWSSYSLAEGPYRDQLLNSTYVPADPTVRPATIGYRLLSYDAGHAKIDLAVRLSSREQTVLTSVLMDLVWQRGDWRFSTDIAESVQATRLVDLTGYTAWSDV